MFWCSYILQNEVLPREVVAVLSQQRREELIRLRADDELRRQNQILFCFGDIKVRWLVFNRILYDQLSFTPIPRARLTSKHGTHSTHVRRAPGWKGTPERRGQNFEH